MDFAERARAAKDKAAEVAGGLAEKAAPAMEKAGELAAKGVDVTASGLNKVTGGRFHDQIENVSNKVEGVLDRAKPGDEPPAAEPKA